MDEIEKLIAGVERLGRERQRLSAAAMVSPTVAKRYADLTARAADAAPILAAEVKRLNAELLEIRQARDTLQAFLSSTSESLDKVREELRAKFSPDAMDLVGQRLVNARKSLDPDAPIWLTAAMDEAWQVLAFLRRNSAQQAARIEQQDEEIAKLHDAVTFADQQGAEAIERVSTAIVNDKWNATAAFQARALKAEKERDELRLALAAEQGKPEGAPSADWKHQGLGTWLNERTGAVVRRGGWPVTAPGESTWTLPSGATGTGANARAAMQAADEAA